MAAKKAKRRKSATKRKTARKAPKRRAAPRKTARKTAPKKRASKRGAKMSDAQVASAFSRAVHAGSAPMARKLASELKRRSVYGIYSAPGVSAGDLRGFEALTKKRKRS